MDVSRADVELLGHRDQPMCTVSLRQPRIAARHLVMDDDLVSIDVEAVSAMEGPLVHACSDRQLRQLANGTLPVGAALSLVYHDSHEYVGELEYRLVQGLDTLAPPPGRVRLRLPPL